MAGNLKAFLAEFIGTFAIVLFAAGAACMDVVTGGKVGLIGLAAAYGGAVMLMGSAFGRASGGHFNPALTAALIANSRINAVKGSFYVAAQVLGAALAGILLHRLLHDYPALHDAQPFLGGCDLGGIGFKGGTLLEAVTTFFLVSAFYGAAVDERAPAGGGHGVIGTAYALGVLATAPLTGAAMNPARAFGPAVITGHWTHWYVYWIGPLAGAFAAAYLHEALYLEKKA